ncbi:DNA-binding MarR family transcriptional regulator [Allocatelliglobosispora scoriae]|uniref:DNA-binding MarR family transcriptional regulator n=1 Tax=Allocatelliglobosispora scoriae TaxID=643052 RepID=A0A841BIA2_9ACTN|nr:MarR family winged helix-turn-helix transcriptional regulator [Allocatelliglobosispora scoriae]MBB5866899.1 DNA-binding MarR family transcriptional regulator [Allocatelliglobosispora scoriae]
MTPPRLAALPSWLLTQTAAHAHRLVADTFAAQGSRGYHYRLLAALADGGPASQAVLGRRTGIDRSDVVAALNELADQALIERSPDPDDRRRNTVTITGAGTARLDHLDEVLTGVQDQLLAPLSPDERATLIRLLTRVLDQAAP